VPIVASIGVGAALVHYLPKQYKASATIAVVAPGVSPTFVSGSAPFDAMLIMPCSMGTVGRIAHGYSDSVITRAADVFLKEKRKLIVVPRETPWNLIQARNIVTLLEAGAEVIPAIPSFYHRPETALDMVDTVLARVMDHLGLTHPEAKRWMDEKKS